jgi:hypothetical protein
MGQRSCEPHQQAEHMAATDQLTVQKTLANTEPSTHGTTGTSRRCVTKSACS